MNEWDGCTTCEFLGVEMSTPPPGNLEPLERRHTAHALARTRWAACQFGAPRAEATQSKAMA